MNVTTADGLAGDDRRLTRRPEAGGAVPGPVIGAVPRPRSGRFSAPGSAAPGMVSLRTRYAGELAVLCTWVSALLPWSLSFASRGGIEVVIVRWQFFLFQFVLGATIPGEQPFQTVVGAIGFQSGATATAYWVWLVGAVPFLLALGLSVAYYAREERVEARLPVDPVRALGGLLLASGLLLAAATVLLATQSVFGAVPVGVVFLLAFGAVLLRVEHVGAA